jgi:hypothetical protein
LLGSAPARIRSRESVHRGDGGIFERLATACVHSL